MSKRGYLAAGVGVLALMASSSAFAYTLCDNYGRTWEIEIAPCDALSTGQCVSGVRDTEAILCGYQLPVNGAIALGVLSVTAFDSSDDNDPCVSTQWTGQWNKETYEFTGDVYNENGFFGTFTLSKALCERAATAGGADPSSR